MFDLTRRQLLQTMAASATLGALPARAEAPAGASDHDFALHYHVPARAWFGSLPLGNGRLGAMVWDGIARERLQINEDTLFAGCAHDPVNPRGPAQERRTPRVRRCAGTRSRPARDDAPRVSTRRRRR